MDPQMIDTLQGHLTTLFSSYLTVMSNAGYTLFVIGVFCGLANFGFALIRSVRGGGGAILDTVAWRIFVIASLSALVTGWPALSKAISNDVNAFASHLAQSNSLLAGVDFTPGGILMSNDRLTTAIYQTGSGDPFQVLSMMQIWKVIAIAFVQLGNGILALDLFFGNISLSIIFGTCSFLIGFIINPWLSSFTHDFIKLIVSTSVFIILIGVFTSAGQSVATISLNYITNLQHGVEISGLDMITIGGFCLVFGILAAIVPFIVASRIGGGPFVGISTVLESVRSGKASVGL